MRLIRCENSKEHYLSKNKRGDILVVLGENSVYAKCTERKCKQWWKITIDIPGIDLNLSNCGVTMEAMPKNFKFKRNEDTNDIDYQPVVVQDV